MRSEALNKNLAGLNIALDVLSQFRFQIDATFGVVPNAITVAWENLYALTYLEMKRIEADIENFKLTN